MQDALTGAHFPGQERDEAEVRNDYPALEAIDALAATFGRIDEADLKRMHGLVMTGRHNPTCYRDGRNGIRDARTGGFMCARDPSRKNRSYRLAERHEGTGGERLGVAG